MNPKRRRSHHDPKESPGVRRRKGRLPGHEPPLAVQPCNKLLVRDVVVEAGANIGTHTVPLSKLVGIEGSVHAFEPQRLVFQMLRGNLALNQCQNVVAQELGLGRSRTRMVTPRVDPNQANNFGGLSLLQEGDGEAVTVVTLDSINLGRCRLIKADVEGMEEDVILGALETIARCRPLLYLENDRSEHSAALLRRLMDLDYKIWWHCPLVAALRWNVR